MKKTRINLIFLVVILILAICSIFTYAQEFHWRCMIPTAAQWEIPSWYQIAEEIKNATDGKVIIDVFIPGEHPYKLADFLKVVSTGEAEICGIIPGYVSSIEPGLSILDLHLLIPGGNFEIYTELFKKFQKGYFKKVFEKWHSKEILSALVSGQNFYLKEGWIENSESLKGKKIRSWSNEVTNFIKLMNGIPVTTAFDENYTALQTGLLDGTTTSFGGAYQANFLDLCKHVVMTQHSFGSVTYLVNIDAWNKLPKNLQEIVGNIFESKRELFETGDSDNVGRLFQLAFTTKGIEARGIPEAYRKELTKGAYKAIWKPWIERAGKSGEEAFNEVVKLIKQLGYDVPTE